MSRPRGLDLALAAAWCALTLPLLLSGRSLAYDDHLEPAVLLQEHGRLPAADACWECHQPPLHYLALALAFELTGAETASARLATARGLTFALAAGLWLVALALARRLAGPPPERRLAALFFLTLPACFLLHVTLSNDVAAVLLSGLLFAWLAGRLADGARASTPRDWALAGALAGLGLLVKTTALPGVAALGLAAFASGGRGAARWRCLGAALGALAVVVGPWLAWNLADAGHPLPLRMHAQAYPAPDPGFFTSFRFADLLAEPFGRPAGATFLDHLDHPGPVDGSWWTRLYSLFFHESLDHLPPLWAPLVAALYLAGLPVLGFLGLGAFGALRPGADRLQRLALAWAVAAFALLVAFNLAYPSRQLVHGKALFVLPAWPALFLLYVRGVQAAREAAGGRLRPVVHVTHLAVQALFLAHAVARVASLA